jgi:predicted small secreted protein
MRTEDSMKKRTTSRRVGLALGLLVAALSAACQTSGGIGMDFKSGGPAWGPFTGGVMYGSPAW